jgi:peptidoglycan/xylan/chitin deacetylase (PgdA/CDA1 family)
LRVLQWKPKNQRNQKLISIALKQKSLKLLLLALFTILVVVVFFVASNRKQPTLAVQKTITNIAKTPAKVVGKIASVSLQQAFASDKQVEKGIRVPVLMYHHVGYVTDANNALENDLTVSPTDFEAQVVYFKNLGYQSVTLAEVYDNLTNGKPLPKKPIVFTFDDGYKDVFVNAIPILQKYGFTGTFAIATELLGRPTYAVWDDVIAAHNQGMEIVSHTENHLDLTSPVYSEADLHREIFDSKQKLEQELGVSVDFFVYPYGKYNQHVEDLLTQAGYKMAFTTAYSQYLNENNLLSEPRVRVHGGNGLEKLKKIFDPVVHNATALVNP